MGIGDAKPLPKHCLGLLIGERLDWGGGAVCGREWNQYTLLS